MKLSLVARFSTCEHSRSKHHLVNSISNFNGNTFEGILLPWQNNVDACWSYISICWLVRAQQSLMTPSCALCTSKCFIHMSIPHLLHFQFSRLIFSKPTANICNIHRLYHQFATYGFCEVKAVATKEHIQIKKRGGVKSLRAV